MRCAQITIAILAFTGVSSIQSCFSQVSVLVNRNRAGIADISISHLKLLCFGMQVFQSMKLSVKRINPTPAPTTQEIALLSLAIIGGC